MSAPPTVLNCLLFLLKILSLSPSFSLILIFSVSTHRSICSDWLRGRRKPWLRWRCRRAETSAASQSRWTPVAGDRWRYYIPLDLKRKMSKRKTKKACYMDEKMLVSARKDSQYLKKGCLWSRWIMEQEVIVTFSLLQLLRLLGLLSN